MNELQPDFEDLSKHEVHHLLACLEHENPISGLPSDDTLSSQDIDYAGVRQQLATLANLSPEYNQKMRDWLTDFQGKSAQRVILADIGPNEGFVMIAGMVSLVALVHALTLKEITQEGDKTTQKFYSLPAELGKMFKSIPDGLVDAVKKLLD
jgi:hypothetical protein